MKVTMHWGDTIEIEGGMPGDTVELDGEPTPFQFGSSLVPAGDRDAAIAAVVEWLGPDFYGYDDGDLESALESYSIEVQDEA